MRKESTREPSKAFSRQKCAVTLSLIAVVFGLAHHFWQPGQEVRDGRHDRRQNALWLEHGWLGDDRWFRESERENKRSYYRSSTAIRELAQLCDRNGITDLYPHLCPTRDGEVTGLDTVQAERLLDNTPHLRIMPWIGGRLDGDVRAASPQWRKKFIASVIHLLRQHPRFAGVHLNIEPWRNNNREALALLEELHDAMQVTPGKVLSIAAYPPQEWYWPFKSGWNAAYFREVASHCDQMAIMAYDSSIQDSKFFRWSVGNWTETVLNWTQDLPHPPRILIGVPTYADAGTTWGAVYHNGRVESLENSLAGIHDGLSRFSTPPANFQGIGIYSLWETDEKDWNSFHRDWGRPTRENTSPVKGNRMAPN